VSGRSRTAARVALAMLAALAGAFAVDRLHAAVGADDVRWLVGPAVGLVELAGGGPFEWEPGEGFLVRAARLRVTEKCAGLRFLLVSTALLSLAWGRRGAVRDRLGAVLLAAAAAFVVTTVANALRLGVALWLGSVDVAAAGWTFDAAHRASSLAVYGAAFLVLVALGRRGCVRDVAQAESPRAA
jgi:exosortase K